MRYVLLALCVAGALAVACGGGDSAPESVLQAADVDDPSTCNLSPEHREALESLTETNGGWVYFGADGGDGRFEGVSLRLLFESGEEYLIPICADQEVRLILNEDLREQGKPLLSED